MEFNLMGPLRSIAALMTTIQMAGVLIGPLLSGQLSDRVFIGLGVGGLLSCMFTLVTECLLPKYRLYIYFGGWPLGFCVLALLSMATRHWKILTFAICAVQILPTLACFFIVESPKWLLERNRFSEALEVLEKMCRMNRKDTSELKTIARNKEAVKRLLIISFSWFTVSGVYYGLVFYSGSLPGDPAVNTLIFGVLRVGLSCLLPIADSKIPKLGRNVLLQFGLLSVGAFIFSSAVILATDFDKKHPMVLVVAAMGAIVFGACIWAACELFSVELFPTVLRNMGNAMCNSVARIGSMIAPQILLLEYLWRPGPMVIFFVLLLLNSVLAFALMPETKGKPLPDLEDDNNQETNV